MLEIIDCDQGTEAWRRARAGIPTASNFATVLASGRGGDDSVTRRKYLYQLAGEIITGEPMESYSNSYMERGKVMEEEARNFYSFLTDSDPQQTGFIRNGSRGCSPDSLIGENGMLEIKTHKPDILIDLIFKDQFPPEHKAQTQGAIWVAEREWIDLICYFSGMPPMVKRADRDEAYIARLGAAIDQFNGELATIVGKIRAYGGQEAAGAAA
jgi:YqaJ-like viral recombinase domain